MSGWNRGILGSEWRQQLQSEFILEAGLLFYKKYIRYLMAAGIAYLLLYHLLTERLYPRKILRGDRKMLSGQIRREVTYSALSAVFFAGANILIAASVYVGISQISFSLPVWWWWVNIIVMLISHDTYFYWSHRFLHLRRVFRVGHATHHRSINSTPWAAYAFDPLEGFLNALFVQIYIVLVPAHPITIVAFVTIMIIKNAIGHSGYEINPSGWTKNKFTDYFTTVTHHDLHHQSFHFNFGLYFTFWDRLMKTEHPDYHANFEAAVEHPSEKSIKRSLLITWLLAGLTLLFLLPFVEFLKR